MQNKRKLLIALLLVVCLVAAGVFFGGSSSAENITVTEIEKYGNLVLSVSSEDFLDLGYACGDIVTATVNGTDYTMPVGSSYSDVNNDEMICRVYINEEEAENAVILAINMGDFATTTGLAEKTVLDEEPGFRWDYADGVETPVAVSFTMQEAGGYLEEYNTRNLIRSCDRADYPHLTDAEYANFRPITTTGMGEGILYRSSSPVNPKLSRNTYADAAVKTADIRTILNLADSRKQMEGHDGWSGSYYAGCNIIPLDLGLDFAAADFQSGLADGLRFLAENEGPYLLHCTEGKDRAGFTSALLECLMGASAQEVMDDYMRSYYNYFGVEPGTEQYDHILETNIIASLAAAFDIEDIRADGVDLAAEAAEYLVETLGLTEAEVAQIRENLSVSAE